MQTTRFAEIKDITLDSEKIDKIINKARLIGCIVEVVDIGDNNKYCLVSRGKDCTLYIPDNVETINKDRKCLSLYSNRNMYLTGKLTVVGGKSIETTHKWFNGCVFSDYDFTKFRADNIEDMSSMFENADITKLNLSGLNMSHVQNAESMFYMSSINNLVIKGADTRNIKCFDNFISYSNINKADFENLDTESAITMKKMFAYVNIDKLDLRNFKLDNVISAEAMFEGCRTNTLDIRGLNFSNIKFIRNIIFLQDGKLLTTDNKILEIHKSKLRTGV